MLLFISVICMANVNADSPPQASEVFTNVRDKWVGNQINDLEVYIFQIYNDYPQYIPAILASSFHDSIFLGKLSTARAKLIAIKSDATSNPQKYSEDFTNALNSLIKELDYEIEMHVRHGTTNSQLEAGASVSAVRSAWGSDLLPQILILEYANNVSLSQ